MGHNSVVSGYLKSTGIPQVDGWLTYPRVLGHHSVVWSRPWYSMVATMVFHGHDHDPRDGLRTITPCF